MVMFDEFTTHSRKTFILKKQRSILRSIVKDVFTVFHSFYLCVIGHINLVGEVKILLVLWDKLSILGFKN